MVMIRTELLVPIRDNDDKAFTRRDWLALEEQLGTRGAWTRYTDVTGEWKNAAGKVHRDRNRQYRVELDSWKDLAGWLDVAQWVCKRFRQESVHIDVHGGPENLPCGGG